MNVFNITRCERRGGRGRERVGEGGRGWERAGRREALLWVTACWLQPVGYSMAVAPTHAQVVVARSSPRLNASQHGARYMSVVVPPGVALVSYFDDIVQNG